MYTHSFVQEGLKFLVVLFFKRITRSMLINTDPTNTTTSRRPRPVQRRTIKSSQPGTLKLLSDFVLVVTQSELIRSRGVFVSMCALTQHSYTYAVPGSNPMTWIVVILVLTLGTSISWIWPSDSTDVVHDRSYPLMILSLGIECSDTNNNMYYYYICLNDKICIRFEFVMLFKVDFLSLITILILNNINYTSHSCTTSFLYRSQVNFQAATTNYLIGCY